MRKIRLIASSLVVASILALNPIKANAEWRQDNNGWRYTEGNSYVKGTWKLVDGNWYYFFADGYMAYNTSIDGYYVNSSGAWVSKSNSSSSETATSSETKIATSSNPKYTVSSINDEWRAMYFKWQTNYYTGVKQSYFENMTKAIADGSLSKESAEAQLNALGRWSEPDGKTSHKIINATITVYETSLNDPQGIINDAYYSRTLTGGDSYSNSYLYYDSSTGKNIVVMIGLGFVNSQIISTTYTN